MSIKVECTWGEGADIIIMGEDQKLISLSREKGSNGSNHEVQDFWQLDLTIEEAKSLIERLQKEVKTAERLRDICK